MILSIPTLRRSFAAPDDGYHVGFHEFAHLLDLDVELTGMEFDGLPAGVAASKAAEWDRLRGRELRRLRQGSSILDPYAETNAVEFFAVAVEAFFERPVSLRDRHPELYRVLSGYFRQDPAAWESA